MKQNKFQNSVKLAFVLIVIVSFIIIGCIEEDETSLSAPINIEYRTSSLLLQKFESDGDFINSLNNYPLINANELYKNPNNFIIIDIRTPYEFVQGRIPNSINISPDDLFNYLDSTNYNNAKKVVLVSNTGQRAAFCCSLLRLKGHKNIYSLNFGISTWNNDFSSYWNNATKNQNQSFNLGNEVRLRNYSLPDLSNSEPQKIEEIIKEKSENLLNMSFDEKNSISNETDLTITFGTIYADYYINTPNPRKKFKLEYVLDTARAFLMCYGKEDLYYVDEIRKPKFSRQTVFFDLEEDIRSSEMLYNLPTNKEIFIYSYSGQWSAILTAYLRLLGYPARSISFGANNMIYSILKTDSYENAFTQDKIENYSYEKD